MDYPGRLNMITDFSTKNRKAGSMSQRRHVDRNRGLSDTVAGFADGRIL